METWGLTGWSGAGKTTVLDHLSQKSVPTLDLDQILPTLIDRNSELGREGFERVVKIFGASIVDSRGQLDRRLLFKRFMTQPQDKEKLDEAMGPLLLKQLNAQRVSWKASGSTLCFVAGSRFVEWKLLKEFHGICFLEASLEERVKRVAKRDSMGKDEVRLMLGLQDQSVSSRPYAKVIWSNDASPKALLKLVDDFVLSRTKV
jgi:dephospho-CoA kinase